MLLLSSDSTSEIYAELCWVGQGQFQATVTPKVVGPHMIYVLVYEATTDGTGCCWRHVQGAPCNIWVEDTGAASTRQTLADGRGLRVAEVGCVNSFSIWACEEDGSEICFGGDELSVVVQQRGHSID